MQEKLENENVREFFYECEKDFVSSITSEGFGELADTSVKFLFRGQADSNWGLVPSSFRQKETNFLNDYLHQRLGKFSTIKIGVIYPEKECQFRRLAEKKLVSEYYQKCESVGLAVPHLEADAYQYLHTLNDEASTLGNLKANEWPNSQLLPAFAFAQHNGVPTRLLDWTKNPAVACYFAAKSRLENGDKIKGKYISVWRCIGGAIESGKWALEKIRTDGNQHKFGQRLVIAPKQTNSNLRAQNGILSLCFHDLDHFETPDRVLHKTKKLVQENRTRIYKEHSSIFTKEFDYYQVEKYCLRAERSEDLLLHLRDLGISYSYVHPSAEGCLRDIHERIEFPRK